MLLLFNRPVRQRSPSRLENYVRGIIRDELARARGESRADLSESAAAAQVAIREGFSRACEALSKDLSAKGELTNAVLKTAVAALSVELRRTQRMWSTELEAVRASLADLSAGIGAADAGASAAINTLRTQVGEQIEGLHARLSAALEQEGRGRNELLTQLAFYINDFKLAVSRGLSNQTAEIEAVVSRAGTDTLAALDGQQRHLLREAAGWSEGMASKVDETLNHLSRQIEQGRADAADNRGRLEAFGVEMPGAVGRELWPVLGDIAERTGELARLIEALPATASSHTAARLEPQLQAVAADASEIRVVLQALGVEMPGAVGRELGPVLDEIAARTGGLARLIEALPATAPSADTAERLEPQLQAVAADASEIRAVLQALGVEMPGAVGRELGPVLDELAARTGGLARLIEALPAAPSGDTAEQSEAVSALAAGLAQLNDRVTENRVWLERIHGDVPDLTNALFAPSVQALSDTLTTTRNYAEDAYKWARQANDGMTTRFNVIENVKITGLAAQVHQAVALQLADLARRQPPPKAAGGKKYAAATPATFDSYLARATHDYPKVFPLWWERFEFLGRAFDETKIGNAANDRDLYSHMFCDFVKIYGRGRVLDVGPGVFGRPYYLKDYPAELISGIEPLPMKVPADFELVRGLGEYLPWAKSSFSTVISGTSLDHCLSLDDSLAEMKRVLTDDGRLLLWVDLVPGSPRYEPNAPDYQPADQFHLFHFDKSWFEPMLDQQFEILERVDLDLLSFFSKTFYVLRKI